MPSAKEVKPDPDSVPNKPGKDLVTDEMKEAAAAQAKKASVKKATESARSGAGVLRKKGGGGVGGVEMMKSDIPYPAHVHGENFEFYGPSGNAAYFPEGTEMSASSADQEFVIDKEKVTFLYFDKPGRNLPKKRLCVVKALHKDGRIVQIGFEPQINNTAGGDPGDAIGLHRMERKGIHLFLNWETMETVYCSAWGCWAQAEKLGSDFVNYCSMRHAQHTLPNQYKGASTISKSLMESGVTTSNVWGA